MRSKYLTPKLIANVARHQSNIAGKIKERKKKNKWHSTDRKMTNLDNLAKTIGYDARQNTETLPQSPIPIPMVYSYILVTTRDGNIPIIPLRTNNSLNPFRHVHIARNSFRHVVSLRNCIIPMCLSGASPCHHWRALRYRGWLESHPATWVG